MQQTYRRQLLALSRMQHPERDIDARCTAFVESVLAGAKEARPDAEGVRDVLMSIGISAPAAGRFADTYEVAVRAA